jgi:hypothetical protein
MKQRLFVAALFVALLPVMPASAEPIFFTDYAAFAAAAGHTTLEDFATSFADTPSVNVSGFTLAAYSDDGLIRRWFNGTDGNGGFFIISGGLSSVVLDFDVPVTAFGISIVDFGTTTAPSTLVFDDGTGSRRYTVATGPLANGTELFFGVVDRVPFRHAVLTSTSIDDSIFFDRVLYNRVPDAGSTLLLLGLAAVALRTVPRVV